MRFRLDFAIALMFFLLPGAIGFVSAQDDSMPQAQIVNDEGGAVTITGSFSIEAQFYKLAISEPLVMLEDEAGFVDRDLDFVFPPASQVIGAFTNDFYADNPITYQISLPIE